MDLFEVLSRFIPLSSSFSTALDPKYSYIILPYTLGAGCVWAPASPQRPRVLTHINDPPSLTSTDNVLDCFQKVIVFVAYLDTGVKIFFFPQWITSWTFSDILSPLLCHFTHRRAEIIPSGICLITSKTSGNPTICWSDHRLSPHPFDSQVGSLALTDRFYSFFWGTLGAKQSAPKFTQTLAQNHCYYWGTNARKAGTCGQ